MIYSLVPKGIGISPGSVMVGHKQCSALFMGQYLVLSKRLTFCNGEVILKNIEYSLTSNGNCFSPRNGEVILKFTFSSWENLDWQGFSPRNGEVILKMAKRCHYHGIKSFSPRNGEVILKCAEARPTKKDLGFSPRNGEVILKWKTVIDLKKYGVFQSPQWGSNSKGVGINRRFSSV